MSGKAASKVMGLDRFFFRLPRIFPNRLRFYRFFPKIKAEEKIPALNFLSIVMCSQSKIDMLNDVVKKSAATFSGEVSPPPRREKSEASSEKVRL